MTASSTGFDGLLGNARVKSCLSSLLQQQRVGHSLLFAGRQGIGKGLFALELAKQVIIQGEPSLERQARHRELFEKGQHPDVHVFRPEGKTGLHSISAIRRLVGEMSLLSYEGSWKLCVLHEAERMLPTSANALLKTVEEPSPKTLILLLSSAPELLLPTLRSRCRLLAFQGISAEEISAYLVKEAGVSPEEARELALRSRGSLGEALRLSKEKAAPQDHDLLQLLSQGEALPYFQALELIERYERQLEAGKSQLEAALRQDVARDWEGMGPVQREAFEKELEGALTLELQTQAMEIFNVCLLWFRDLFLLRSGGEARHLFFPEFGEQLKRLSQSPSLLSLESVEKAIKEAELALQRSIKFSTCFENFLLKLSLLN